MRFKVLGILVAISIAAFGLPAHGAELKFRVEHGRFSYLFAGDPIWVTVFVTALDVSERQNVRPEAHCDVRFTATGEDGNVLELQAEPGRTISNRLIDTPQGETLGVRQKLWLFEGVVKLSPLPAGTYTLTASYVDLVHSTTLRVWNGDEDADARAALLGREAERTTDYSRFRSLQLARLELQPTNSGILWELAGQAEYRAPIEETDRYYAQALAIVKTNVESEWLKAKVNDIEDQRNEARRFELVINAIRALLPEFYQNREGLMIEKPSYLQDSTVRLVDVKTKRVLKALNEYPARTQPSAGH